MFFDKAYFENVFRSQDPWGYTISRFERVKYFRQIRAIRTYFPQPRDILEVGCAEGIHSVILADAFPTARIYSIDISRFAIIRARKNCERYKNIELIESDIVRMLKSGALADNGFDVIIQSESLYYLFPRLLLNAWLAGYVANLTSRLRGGGIFITSNGINTGTWLCMQCYYSIIKRFCTPLYSARFKGWNEVRNRFVSYDLKVFRSNF